MNDDKIIITSEDGTEHEFQILFTFDSEDYGKSYVVFLKEGEDEVYVHSYTEDENGTTGSLEEITDDEEWDMIEEIIEAFITENEVENA